MMTNTNAKNIVIKKGVFTLYEMYNFQEVFERYDIDTSVREVEVTDEEYVGLDAEFVIPVRLGDILYLSILVGTHPDDYELNDAARALSIALQHKYNFRYEY